MKKKLLFTACMLLLFTAFVGNSIPVQASTEYKVIGTNPNYQTVKERTVGKTTFESTGTYLYAIKNGKRTLLASGLGLGNTILTNGSTVYYDYSFINNSPFYVTSTVYSIPSIGKKGKKLFSVKDVEPICFHGYYSGKIYYGQGELYREKFCSYSIKSGKRRKIAGKDAGGIKQFGQYFYLIPSEGEYWPITFRVYNAKTGKLKTISKKMLNNDIISNSVYYVESKSSEGTSGINGRRYFDIAVKKCRLNGSNKKTLVKDLRITGVKKIRKNSITYYDVNGKEKTKRF